MATAAAATVVDIQGRWDLSHDREVKRATLIDVLSRCRWHKLKAARELGLTAYGLYKRMRAFDVPLSAPEGLAPKLDGDYVILGRYERRCIQHNVKLDEHDLICLGKTRVPKHRVIEWAVFDTFEDRPVCEVSVFGFLRICQKRDKDRRP